MLDFNLFLCIISLLFFKKKKNKTTCFIITTYNLSKNIWGWSGWLLQSTQVSIMEGNNLFAWKNERFSFSRLGSLWVILCLCFYFSPLWPSPTSTRAAFLRNPSIWRSGLSCSVAGISHGHGFGARQFTTISETVECHKNKQIKTTKKRKIKEGEKKPRNWILPLNKVTFEALFCVLCKTEQTSHFLLLFWAGVRI